MIQFIPQERLSERIVEQIVDAPGADQDAWIASEPEELQRQEVQAELISWQFGSLFECQQTASCLVAPDMIEGHHGSFPTADSYGVSDLTPCTILHSPKRERERTKRLVIESNENKM